MRPSFTVRFSYAVLLALALLMRNCLVSGSNSTQVSLDEDDDSLSEMTLAEFKERYRRLIPYMTFYVANNYVHTKASLAQSNPKDLPISLPLRKPQQHTSTRLGNVPKRTHYRVNVQNPEKQFIPSVQYDPSNIGGDNDYFTPVKYSSKVNYDDYTVYQTYQGQKAAYPEITTPSAQITHKENRYYTNVRPLRPYTTSGRDHYPRKQSKPAVHAAQDALDYSVRPSASPVNYPAKEFQGLRYIPPVHSNVQPIQILDQISGRQPSTVPQIHRNPNVNLNRLVESFHLSERLPEMLNSDNLDNSLKTLVEILNILHNSKKEELPQIQAPPLTQLAPVSSLQRFPQKLSNYENIKVRAQTRPKVITETRFQATPSPLFLTEDPDRFKVASYEPKPRPPPNYNVNGLSNNKIVEYYTPYVQEIPEDEKAAFRPTIKPQVGSGSTENSYEITEDLSDDILQDDRFSLPVTTEHPGHGHVEQPNEIAVQEPPRIPQMLLKYGVTRGKPAVDYPAYATIPETDFSCKEQRYKGFFGDPATGCQVWHYCDLNGGKSSFLCPNGTIFSQVALTCDWWFNVKCETTRQLYVLNERLYKYILPIMPKFPEDFTGPEVDRYLELKFKEMEAKLKEKKLKKQQEEKEKLKDKLQTLQEEE